MNCETMLPAGAPRDLWLAERRKGLTSTDAAPLSGMCPWRTPLEVYLDKRGILPERDPNAAMEWGLRLEPVLAEAYSDRTGFGLSIPPKLVRSRNCPHRLASLDRVASDGRIVELKTTRTAEGWGQAGSDDLPRPYLLQVHHQMLVTGVGQADVAVLIGGSDFRVYQVEYSEALGKRLADIEDDFWAMQSPPPPDWTHPSTPELLAAMSPECVGEISLDAAACVWAIGYRELGEQIRQSEAEREELKSRLLHAMGSAALARLPDGTQLTRKTINRREYTAKATSYVQFSVKAPKGAS